MTRSGRRFWPTRSLSNRGNRATHYVRHLLAARVNGTFLFLLADQSGGGRKVCEIRSLSTWPLVVVRSDAGFESVLVTPDGTQSLSSFQHLSIPRDYNLHFTGPHRRMFFEPPKNTDVPSLLFSFISRSVSTYPEPKGRWAGGVALLFPGIPHNPDRRFLLDFFIHGATFGKDGILAQPPSALDAQYIGMNDGNYLGPFSLPVAASTSTPALMCSVRYGVCRDGDRAAETFLVPRRALVNDDSGV